MYRKSLSLRLADTRETAANAVSSSAHSLAESPEVFMSMEMALGGAELIV